MKIIKLPFYKKEVIIQELSFKDFIFILKVIHESNNNLTLNNKIKIIKNKLGVNFLTSNIDFSIFFSHLILENFYDILSFKVKCKNKSCGVKRDINYEVIFNEFKTNVNYKNKFKFNIISTNFLGTNFIDSITDLDKNVIDSLSMKEINKLDHFIFEYLNENILKQHIFLLQSKYKCKFCNTENVAKIKFYNFNHILKLVKRTYSIEWLYNFIYQMKKLGYDLIELYNTPLIDLELLYELTYTKKLKDNNK